MAAFVTGGCGFIGYHLVKALLQNKEYTAVHVLSRNPTKNLVEGAEYHKGDFCSKSVIEALFKKIGDIDAIFHVASPPSAGNTGTLQSYLQPNVGGTQNLLECARNHGVKAFIFSSSQTVYAPDQNNDLINVSEDSPLITLDSSADSYSKSKAEAERCVLAANGALKTVSIRISGAHGERDEQLVGAILVNRTKWRDQIGDNKNLWDHVSVENCCDIHLKAARALLQDVSGVAGEAFNVTDGQPIPFWTFIRLVWTTAGENIDEEQIRIIPAGLMLILASIVEWTYCIFTFGQLTPKELRRHRFEYMVVTRTLSIEKAKNRLGYIPADNMIASLKAAVKYFEERGN